MSSAEPLTPTAALSTIAKPDPFRSLTALSIALFALALLWAVSGDPRQVAGGPVWMKPAKFALSFILFFWTLALVRDRLSPKARDGRAIGAIGLIMGVAFTAEMAWMFRQAARGAESHFNTATPSEAAMYALMGVGAVSLVVGAGAVGWIALRDRSARMGPALREGVWLGLALGAALTLVVAGTMSAGKGPHVGTTPAGTPTLPLLGWSGVVGDLRPAHFLALHAMQVLPLLGLWIDRRGTRAGVRLVRWAALGWTALTLGLFVQALSGLPMFRLG